MFAEDFLHNIWLLALLHGPDWPSGPGSPPAPPSSPHLPHGLLVVLEVGRQAGAQVEDGEEDVDLLLLREEVGVGLAQSHLLRGEGQVPDVRVRLLVIGSCYIV